MPKPIDQRSRPFTQIRLYGELAEMVDERAELEGKSRSTVVEELLRAAWHIVIAPEPLTPQQRFERQPSRPSERPPPPTPPPRAHVYAPQRYR